LHRQGTLYILIYSYFFLSLYVHIKYADNLLCLLPSTSFHVKSNICDVDVIWIGHILSLYLTQITYVFMILSPHSLLTILAFLAMHTMKVVSTLISFSLFVLTFFLVKHGCIRRPRYYFRDQYCNMVLYMISYYQYIYYISRCKTVHTIHISYQAYISPGDRFYAKTGYAKYTWIDDHRIWSYVCQWPILFALYSTFFYTFHRWITYGVTAFYCQNILCVL